MFIKDLRNMYLAWEPKELLFRHNNEKVLMFINNIKRFGQEPTKWK